MKNKIEKSIQKTIVYNDDLGHTVEVITPIVGNSDLGVLGTLSHLVDDKEGESHQTGWVFQKKVKYEDCNEYYIEEVWVTVHEKMPVSTYTEFPKYLD